MIIGAIVLLIGIYLKVVGLENLSLAIFLLVVVYIW